MSLSKTWIGLAIGGGAAIGLSGKTGYIIQLVNCAHATNTVSCVVEGTRNGLALHVGCGVSFAIVTGVGSPKDFETIKGTGIDFAVDIGVKAGEVFKWGAKSGKASLDMAVDFARMSVLDLQQFIMSDRGKAFLNALSGDLKLSNDKPSFAMFGTPLGAGLGAGFWYETQRVCKLGAMDAWACVPICWRFVQHKGDLWLQVKDIPAPDGSKIHVLGLQGTSSLAGVIQFQQPKGPRRYDGNRPQQYDSHTVGVVKNYALHEDAKMSNWGPGPDGGGINLSIRSLGAVRSVFGGLSMLPGGSTVDLGLVIRYQKKQVWASYQSGQLCLSGNGRVSTITPTGQWRY